MENSASATMPTFTRKEAGLLAFLFAVQFANILDFVIMMPLAPILRTELGLSPQQFSWALSSYGLVGVLGSLGGSAFIDRFSRRSALLAMLGGFAAGTFACGWARNFPELLAARAATGLFGGLLGTTALAIIGDVFSGPRRGRAMGAVMSAFATASVIGVPIGLALAENGGRGMPFLALGGVAAATWLAGWIVLPPLRGHLNGGPKPSMAGMLRRPGIGFAFLFMGCIVGSGFLVIPFLADSLVKNNGLDPLHLKWVYLVAGLCTFASTNAVGWAADKLGKAKVYRVAAVAAAAAALMFTHLPPLPTVALIAAATVFMVATSGRMVPAQALVVGCVPAAERGAFLSLLTALQHGVMGGASLAAGLLVTATADGHLHGYGWTGVISAAAGLASLALVGRLPVA